MELRAGTAEEAGVLPERIDRVRDLCAGWVKSGHTPSLAVLVARRGVIVLHEAFGCLGPGQDSPPLRLDSIFPVSSVAKPITATAVMTLVEDGLLGLNRPVVDYVPELCGEGTEEILVHHLLTHTSGYNGQKLLPFELQRRKEGIKVGPCDATQHPGIHRRLQSGKLLITLLRISPHFLQIVLPFHRQQIFFLAVALFTADNTITATRLAAAHDGNKMIHRQF